MKTSFAWTALSAAMLLAAGDAALADAFTITYDNAGVQSANLAALCAGSATCVIGTETFETRPLTGTSGGAAFTTNYGTGGAISGAYTGLFGINGPDAYGPAGGVGQYITTYAGGGYSIKLTHSGAVPGVNYFGFWLSALDAGNEFQVLRNGTIVGAYTPAAMLAAVAGKPAYFGNPNNGANRGEPYAFVNFYDTTGFFDEIRIFEDPTVGGYESDNHTVGYRTATTTPGTVLISVPEPGSTALFALGAAGLLAMRRRRRG